MAIEVSREQNGHTSPGRCLLESERASLESACRGELNCIGIKASTWLWSLAERKMEIPEQADIRQSQEGYHWSPLAEGNRMV